MNEWENKSEKEDRKKQSNRVKKENVKPKRCATKKIWNSGERKVGNVKEKKKNGNNDDESESESEMGNKIKMLVRKRINVNQWERNCKGLKEHVKD